MAEYLVSFRVASEDLALSEEKRRQSIYDAVLEVECWAETTSLLIIRCDQAIVELMRILTQKLDERFDMMLIRRVGYKKTIFWGSMTQDTTLIDLVPDARRVSFS